MFDVTPYAEAAMRYFLRNPTNQKLPRKFKITYSASEADRGLIPMHDFGLMAVERNGAKGFRMSVGGGLGAAPRMADVLADWLPVSEQLRSIEAAIKVWDRLGERRNKNKARIKFLVAKIGIDEFRRLWELELETLPPSSDQRYREPDFTLLEEAPAYGSWASRNGGVKDKRAGFDVWRRTNALEQKDAGFYTVYVLLPIGDANAEQMHALAEMARKYAGGHIRTAASQNYVFRWVHEDDLPAIHSELVDIGLAEDHAMTISDVITCPGADTCSIGVTSSKGLGTEIREPAERGRRQVPQGPAGQRHPHQHQRLPELVRPAPHRGHRLLRHGDPRRRAADPGGAADARRERSWHRKVAKLTMKTAREAAPDAVETLVKRTSPSATTARSSPAGRSAPARHGIQELLADYKIVPEFTKDPMAYVDWGQSKFFTLDDMGEGECAV